MRTLLSTSTSGSISSGKIFAEWVTTWKPGSLKRLKLARATYAGDSSFSQGIKNCRGGTSSAPGYWPTPVVSNSKGDGPCNLNRTTLPLQTVARLYPTPTAQAYGYNQGGALPGGPVRMSLQTMAAKGMWPTPSSEQSGKTPEAWQRRNAKKMAEKGIPAQIDLSVAARMWPTPSANMGGGETADYHREKEARHKAGLGPKPQKQLSVAVKMWPTPTSRDHRSIYASAHTHQRNSRPLSEVVGQMWQTPVASEAAKCSRRHGNGSPTLTGQSGGALAPVFVEWLQGFPPEWTACEPLVMPSCLPAPPMLSPPSSPKRKAGKRTVRSLAPLMTSGGSDWQTPKDLFAALHAQHAFTLDAAASDANAQLPKYYTEEDNSLAKTWAPHRVWLNPPYGRAMPLWMAKAAKAKTFVMVLVPARTDTAWWHQWVIPHATQIAYVRGRLTFEGAKGSAPFPSAIITYEPGARRRRPVAIDRMGRPIG